MIGRERLFHSPKRLPRHPPFPLALLAPPALVPARQVTQQRHRARYVPDRAGADVKVRRHLAQRRPRVPPRDRIVFIRR